MLFSLTSLLSRRRETAQLMLALDPPESTAPPRDADALLTRLRALGLGRITRCRLTRNRNVMVSFRGSELRVHEAYLDAPPEVHGAIVAFVEGRTRAERRAAQRRIVTFKVPAPEIAPPRRRERMHPDDQPFAEKLMGWHERFNAKHFGGRLRRIPVRVSRRMKSRLGHYTAAASGESAAGEIAISRRHLRRHGWREALETLLHEMVHQWQDETGRPLDHGAEFRAKAREVGIAPAAKRGVSSAKPVRRPSALD